MARSPQMLTNPLAALKGQVDAFYTSLQTALRTQKGAIGQTGLLSETVEDAAEAAAEGMYKVYGGLIGIYSATPERIGEYYNMELILDREQRDFSGTVPISTTKNIAKRTLDPSARLRIVNSGPTPLRFYFAPEKNDPAGQSGRTIRPQEDETVEARALGTGPYLNVANESTEGDGRYELVML